MSIKKDLAKIAVQEERLQFQDFDADTAWKLGNRLKANAETRGVAVTIEIRVGKETIFFFAMQGAKPENADWARRKRNVVDLLWRSSYAVGLSLQEEQSSLEAKMGLPLRDYTAHGGSFPIRVVGVGTIGTVTVSGLPQRDDHAMLVEELAGMLGVPLSEVALPQA
jgi:uncharacterized protein (UPF0303 family)